MKHTDPNAAFHREVLSPLRRLGWRLRQQVLIAGACRCALMGLALAAIQLSLDRLLVLGIGPRAALLLIVLGILCHQFRLQILQPLTVRFSLADVAALLERRQRDLRDRLISAVAFAAAPPRPDRDSPAMVDALLAGARTEFRRIRPGEVLNASHYRKSLAAGALVLAVLLAANAAAPDLIATYVARDLLLRDTPWPSRTRIIVEGVVNNRLRWPVGDELTLVASADGAVPRALGAEIEFADGRQSLRDTARRGENQFLLEYGLFEETMRVRFIIRQFGADERTDWVTVEAVQRPSVRHAWMRVIPPEYAALPAFDLPRDQTTAEILRGSRLRITAQLAKPVVKATLRGLGGAVTEASIEAGDSVAAEFQPVAGGTFFFDLTDADGLTDPRPLAFSLRVNSDPPPKVRLTLPGAGEMIVPGAVLNLAAECEDNLGLRHVELLHGVAAAAGPPVSTAPAGPQAPAGRNSRAAVEPGQPFPGFEPRMTRFAAQRSWPLADLGLRPGDQLVVYLRAADYQPLVRSASSAVSKETSEHPGVAESMRYTLRIVTPEELLNELARRESEWRREFEQILKSQEELNQRVQRLHDEARGTAPSADWASRYDREERGQRGQAGRLKTVRRQFEQVLEELRVNQLADGLVRRRLEDGIIQPLGRLMSEDCPVTADLMERLRDRFDERTVEAIEQSQAAIVQAMHAVLANMLKWEGYNEAVALMRDILRLQQDVNRQTRARLDRQLERLFGPDAATQPAGREE